MNSQALRRWFSRSAPDSGPITLTQRRIFILPTKQGLAFTFVLFLMLLGDINYNLSLGYVLTFLLAMMALMSAFHAFRNLLQLQIRPGNADPVFCGETAHFTLHFRSTLPRHHLCLRDKRGKVLGFDLIHGTEHHIAFPVASKQRGWLELGRLSLYTEFPLGLFHAWSYLQFEQRCLVYPQPLAGQKHLREHFPDGTGKQQVDGDDDFAGLRKFARGDMLTRVDWKAFAREKGLLVKQFSSPVGNTLWFDLKDTPDSNLEHKLSRLTAWILAAESANLRYGLRLPNQEIAPSQGLAHRNDCLRQLALHQPTSHQDA